MPGIDKTKATRYDLEDGWVAYVALQPGRMYITFEDTQPHSQERLETKIDELQKQHGFLDTSFDREFIMVHTDGNFTMVGYLDPPKEYMQFMADLSKAIEDDGWDGKNIKISAEGCPIMSQSDGWTVKFIIKDEDKNKKVIVQFEYHGDDASLGKAEAKMESMKSKIPSDFIKAHADVTYQLFGERGFLITADVLKANIPA